MTVLGLDSTGIMKQHQKNDMAAASKAGASLQALTAPNCTNHSDIKSQENLLSI